MEKLGSYELCGNLTSQNSGFSVWGFGRKDGRNYFIKQFLSPKYPENDTVSSPERIAKLKRKCEQFERKKRALYERLNRYSDGNAVRIEEFFRVETKYYITMRKIEALHWDVEHLAALPDGEKRFLCAVIAHAVAGLHKAGIVHADLKHDNILFMNTPTGHVTAKVIDFDSGFLESDPPQDGEEIIGDQVYFSPEACKTFLGMPTELTCKMDVFALGVLFHQYYTGSLPDFDTNLGSCAGEAVARGGTAAVADNLPADIRNLLTDMLNADPHQRPSSLEVFARLVGKPVESLDPGPDPVYSPPSADEPSGLIITGGGSGGGGSSSGGVGGTFFRPGDL